jgi:hypothetical protein
LGYLKLIKYYDSNNIIFYRGKICLSYLSESAFSGSLKMIKYFELKAKDAPNFELEIIKCYINAATSNKNKIRIFKYLETTINEGNVYPKGFSSAIFLSDLKTRLKNNKLVIKNVLTTTHSYC